MAFQHLTFRKFSDKAAALELAELLGQDGIECFIEDTSTSFDPGFSYNPLEKEYRLKIRPEDFETANACLIRLSEKELANIEPDHYLYGFTNEELSDIVERPDEWSALDYVLALKLLKDRGHEISPEGIQSMQQQRIDELSAPEKSQSGWITTGYIMALMGGLLGVFIGGHLYYHKKTLPNGERVHAYSGEDRKHGFNIFVLGIIAFMAWLIVGNLHDLPLEHTLLQKLHLRRL